MKNPTKANHRQQLQVKLIPPAVKTAIKMEAQRRGLRTDDLLREVVVEFYRGNRIDPLFKSSRF